MLDYVCLIMKSVYFNFLLCLTLCWGLMEFGLTSQTGPTGFGHAQTMKNNNRPIKALKNVTLQKEVKPKGEKHNSPRKERTALWS